MREELNSGLDNLTGAKGRREKRRQREAERLNAEESFSELDENIQEEIKALSATSIHQAFTWGQNNLIEGTWKPSSGIAGNSLSTQRKLELGIRDWATGNKPDLNHLDDLFTDRNDRQVAYRAAEIAVQMLSAFENLSKHLEINEEQVLNQEQSETDREQPIENSLPIEPEDFDSPVVEEMPNPLDAGPETNPSSSEEESQRELIDFKEAIKEPLEELEEQARALLTILNDREEQRFNEVIDPDTIKTFVKALAETAESIDADSWKEAVEGFVAMRQTIRRHEYPRNRGIRDNEESLESLDQSVGGLEESFLTVKKLAGVCENQELKEITSLSKDLTNDFEEMRGYVRRRLTGFGEIL